MAELDITTDPKAHLPRMWDIVGQRRSMGQTLDEIIEDLSPNYTAGDVFLAWHAYTMKEGFPKTS